MRKILIALGLLSLFAIGPIASHADDGLRALPQSLLAFANTWTANQTFGAAATGTSVLAGNAAPTQVGVFNIGMSDTGGYAWLQAYNSAPIILNPLANSVGVGTTTPKATFHDAGSSLVGPASAATLSAGESGLAKITASGTAPGAGVLKLAAVAGTNTGTCKIIVYAGTSTTPTTLLDNIGAGC